MKKRVWRIAGVLFIAVLAFAFVYARQFARIAASYAAKISCSSIFVSGRNPSSIREDLYAVDMADIDVDNRKNAVTATVYGIASATAVYTPGCGCTIDNGIQEGLIKNPALSIGDSSAGTILLDTDSSFKASQAFLDATDIVFREDIPGVQKKTRALLVLKDCKIIFERYADGFSKDTRLQGWSMTKSVTNAMIGILVKQGKLKVDQPAPVEEWAGDDRHQITLDNLLRMSSGLNFEENYAKPSDATRMLFLEPGAGRYAIRSKLKYKPGTVFYYSSGTTNILQEIIRRQFPAHDQYLAFPYREIFHKIGMKSAVMEMDASGTYVGSSFMYATARDWSRFGLLFLNNGNWNGEQILPENWSRYSASETAPSKGVYGAHFWIDHNDKDLPKDVYFADGFEGQFISVIPSRNMVIVRLGLTHGASFDNGALIKSILKATP